MKKTKRTKAKLDEKGYTVVVTVFDSCHDQNLKFCADNGLLFPLETEISQNNKLEVIYVERIAVVTEFKCSVSMLQSNINENTRNFYYLFYENFGQFYIDLVGLE